jgi:hypothetical protein
MQNTACEYSFSKLYLIQSPYGLQASPPVTLIMHSRNYFLNYEVDLI